jgi:hypothetical protein
MTKMVLGATYGNLFGNCRIIEKATGLVDAPEVVGSGH